MKKLIWIVPVLLLLVSGCAGPNPEITEKMCNMHDLSGFWSGFWHGLIIPFSAWGNILGDGSIVVYESCNNGGWYTFGFAFFPMINLLFGVMRLFAEIMR